jgi:hypothetical protein
VLPNRDDKWAPVTTIESWRDGDRWIAESVFAINP